MMHTTAHQGRPLVGPHQMSRVCRLTAPGLQISSAQLRQQQAARQPAPQRRIVIAAAEGAGEGEQTPLERQADLFEAPPAGSAPRGAAAESSAAATAVAEPEGPSADELKAMLLDSLYGTERGLSASSELRGEISELISQLEAANTSATADVDKLSGEWKLVYTSNSELFALLALSKLPFITVGDITQTIDAATGTVTNKVALMDSVTRTAFSSTANFEVRSPKLLNIKFVRGALATPQLLADVDLPESVSLLGQTVDLSNLRDALAPLRRSLQGAISQAASLLSQQPDLKFDIPEKARAESWLLTTYLDEDTRIARGDGGSVFVLVKEPGSASTAGNGYSNAAAAANSNGNGNGGAWKDDPIRNRTTSPAAAGVAEPPPPANPAGTGSYPEYVPPAPASVPPPVTPPAMNVDAEIKGEGGDLNSY